MKHAPCKTCPDKGCGSRHDSCPAYQEWRAEMDAVREAVAKHHALECHTIENILRIKRRS